MGLSSREKTVLQKEVVDSIDFHPHGILNLAPRTGKTKLIIDLIKRDKYNSILWVTPDAKLAEEDIPEEFKKWKATRYISKLTTSTYASLHKVVGYYDIVILDEIQHITENNSVGLVNRSIDYISIVGMTGTPTKHENKKDLYSALKLKPLYEISIKNAVDVGLLPDYNITVVSVPLGIERNFTAGTKAKPFITTESANYAYLSRQVTNAISSGVQNSITFKILARMRGIKNSPSKFAVAQYLIDHLKGRKLFFCGSIKQAEALTEFTYHSKTNGDHLRDFKNKHIDTLALVNSGGTGHTYETIDNLVVVQADSDKNGLTSQKITRTLLSQGEYKANIWIICLEDTQDEVWIDSVLDNFDRSKVRKITFKQLKNGL